ncbi:hypothetical protein Bbelb_053600 [Branchiostoma belcheri]|nr:hypothetical protein Bbelb_053600 [Branchiostoma belcheri]
MIACVSYYETIRRRHVQSRPENVEKSAKQKSEKCHRSRRKRLLEARAGVLQKEEEASLWKGVTADLMSDEEGCEVNGVKMWLVKPPFFRSPQLTDLCNTLQARLDADPKYRESHTSRRTEEGVFSTRAPPKNYNSERASQHLLQTSTPRLPRHTAAPMSDITNSNSNNNPPIAQQRSRPNSSARSLSFHDLSRSLEGYNEALEVRGDDFVDHLSDSLTAL